MYDTLKAAYDTLALGAKLDALISGDVEALTGVDVSHLASQNHVLIVDMNRGGIQGEPVAAVRADTGQLCIKPGCESIFPKELMGLTMKHLEPGTPSDKAPEMVKQLDDVSEKVFGRKRTDAIKGNVCTTCGGVADEFKDDLSRKEYTISGMCQSCQDSVFG